MRFIPEEDIEAAALDVLASYERRGHVIDDRVPIDDIVERHLGISLEAFDDGHLPAGLKNQVLGYIDIRHRCIGIHESLFPENSGHEGRYNFTLAHEVGHYMLHKREIAAAEGQLGCFEQDEETASRDSDPMEWQADCFASYLMMPDSLVQRYWKIRVKSGSPLTPKQITWRFSPPSRQRCGEQTLVWLFVRNIAREMGVSTLALMVRLKRMGLIATPEPLAATGS